MNIGILGTGVIAYHLVKGFCTDPSSRNLHFRLSPRNAEKAAELAALFPDQVTVCHSNQEVVDRSDWLFLTLIPRMAEEILGELTFRPDLKVLTIMSDHSIGKVGEMLGGQSGTDPFCTRGEQRWTDSGCSREEQMGTVEQMGTDPICSLEEPEQKGSVPVCTAGRRIVRMVPLPFASMHIGPIAYYPFDEEIDSLFAPLGQLIVPEREEELSIISGLTGIMSAYYMLIHETAKFGADQGLAPRTSLDYMTAFFEALSVKARAREDGNIYDLAYEMTPGGLNDMALKSLLADNAYTPWVDALQKVMDRLNKKG